jgi:hypothetical protein
MQYNITSKLVVEWLIRVHSYTARNFKPVSDQLTIKTLPFFFETSEFETHGKCEFETSSTRRDMNCCYIIHFCNSKRLLKLSETGRKERMKKIAEELVKTKSDILL